MSDYISREWLSNAIHNFFNGLNHNVDEEDIQAYINATPSADVRENIKGEWERVRGGSLIDVYCCSKCKNPPDKKPLPDIKTWGWNFTDFCPNCGADMRGGKE